MSAEQGSNKYLGPASNLSDAEREAYFRRWDTALELADELEVATGEKITEEQVYDILDDEREDL